MKKARHDLGPLTAAIFKRDEGQPPALIGEWGGQLKKPGEFVCFWGGSLRRKEGGQGWGFLSVYRGKRGGKAVGEMSAVKVERLLLALAHEGRIRIMQALFDGPRSAAELTKATGFRGGALYHHLRELQYADYVVPQKGQYHLTTLGCELLVTVACIADELIEDRGENGLSVTEKWGGTPAK